MKINATAATLTNALGMAASLVPKDDAKRPAALAAARLVGSDHLTLIVSNRTAELTITIEADAEGEVAVPARRLAELVVNFPPDTEITITATDNVATVSSRKSKFKLPTIPLSDMPDLLALGEETGRVELAADTARELFRRPLFAVGTEETRYYLNGIFLCSTEAGLTSVATDGTRLGLISVAAATSLSRDRSLIVPAAKTITKLLDRATGEVTLRRSKLLFEITVQNFKFVSKLIDGSFPAYERLIAVPTSTVIVDRTVLIAAVARFQAVRDPLERMPGVTLTWGDTELRLTSRDGSADILDADTTGTGKVTVQTILLNEQLSELRGNRVRLAHSGGMAAVAITDPTDGAYLSLLSPMVEPQEGAAP
jgi:DNA polymerase III subunit beta